MVKRALRIKRTMIRALSQEYVEPAHWSARRRHVTAGTRHMKPSGSNCKTLSLMVFPASFGETPFKMKIRMRTVTAPIGRLIRKHQRQDPFDVKAPPSNGPTTDDTPKIAPMHPIYIGRVRLGMLVTISCIEPEKTPAHPTPAIARPTTTVVELSAPPQMADPASKMAMHQRKTHLDE